MNWPRVLLIGAATASLFSIFPVAHVNAAEWGKPLGGAYDGLEGKPRPVTPAPAELGSDERATMAVFERATKSVVFITNTAVQRDIWYFNVMEVPQGSGTGFVWNKQGHIVTNFHVIYGADAIKVTLADRSEYQAKLVGADPDHDLAVLQIKAPESLLEPLAIGASHDLRVGQKVLAIGQSIRVGPHADDRCRERIGTDNQVDVESDDRRSDPDRRRYQSRQLRWAVAR